MKYIFLIILLNLLVECRVKDKPAGSSTLSGSEENQDTPTTTEVERGRITTDGVASDRVASDRVASDRVASDRVTDPNECFIKARVLRSDTLNDNLIYLLEVQAILEIGFGFSKNLKKGDELEARIPAGFPAKSIKELNNTTPVTLTIEYVFAQTHGHYRINDIIR